MNIADECSSWRSMPELERDKFWPDLSTAGEEPSELAQPIQMPYTVASLRFQRKSFMGSASCINVKGRAAQVVPPSVLQRSISRTSQPFNVNGAGGDDPLVVSTRQHLDSDSISPPASHRVSVSPEPIAEADADADGEPGLVTRQV